MKRNWLIAVTIILLVFNMIGCGKDDPEIGKNNKDEQTEKDEYVKNGIPSPLSGIYSSEEKVDRRPVAVMFDNHPGARWQSGLKDAEIVYEMVVEYPYTRYMAIYLINDPVLLGPIRSSRPCFVTTLLEYDPLYVRVGGSEQAKNDIKNLKVADIDGLTSSNEVFYRYSKTNKKSPHNLYSNMDIIRKTGIERGYREKGDFEGFKFNENDTDLNGRIAKNILIKYNKDNSTNYVYDEDEKNYIRYKDGKLHVDEFDNSPITAENIIIQEAKTKTIDDAGRVEIDLVGNGKGIYITNGEAVDITWSKKNRSSKTYFYDEKGQELILNIGVTWIQVVNTNPDITIE